MIHRKIFKYGAIKIALHIYLYLVIKTVRSLIPRKLVIRTRIKGIYLAP